MRRERVLFVDHEVRLSGGQRDLVDLVSALARSGLDLHVALPGPGALHDALASAGATIHRLPIEARLRRASRYTLGRRPAASLSYGVAFVLAAARMFGLVRRLRPDFVHTNSMKAHLIALPAAVVLRVPLVWHIRDILPQGWLLRMLGRLASRFVARVVCLSQVAADQFRSSPASEKVRVVYNGIRLEQFSGDRRDAWRGWLGARPDDVIVALVGQVAAWKGQDVFLQAAARLSSRAPNTRYLIVGDCLFPENEAAYAGRVSDLATSEAIRDRVVWIGWSEEVPAILSAVDVLVHASREPEPFGRVIVEGMAAGKPVVSTSIGAGPELVPADAGFLITPGDPVALARVLERLLSAEERERRGKAAERAAGRFDIAHTADGVLRVYTEVRCA